MKVLSQIATAIAVFLFWLVWMPCAFIKDLAELIYVPFDSQRCVNTYIQTLRNLQTLVSVWTPIPPEPKKEEQQGFRVMGFHPGRLRNLENPPDEYEEEDEDDY